MSQRTIRRTLLRCCALSLLAVLAEPVHAQDTAPGAASGALRLPTVVVEGRRRQTQRRPRAARTQTAAPAPGDDENTFRVPAATVFDALLSYEWNGVRLALNASSLFDKAYVSSCSGIDYCYYAERRKVVASLRYRW